MPPSNTRLDPDGLGAALRLAAELHLDQRRKGTEIPYVSHVMAVAGLVAEDGGSTDEVVAAFLHDAAEDQGGRETLQRIRTELGEAVAALVEECSDSLLETGSVKESWWPRKQRVVDDLANRSPGALRITAADKLHNVRATLVDLETHGEGVWDRFNTGREGFLWYHGQVLSVLQERLPGSRTVRQLTEDLARIQDLAQDAT